MARPTPPRLTAALLTIGYVLLVVPAGLVLRVLRDPLRRSWSRHRQSYWQNSVDRQAGRQQLRPREPKHYRDLSP